MPYPTRRPRPRPDRHPHRQRQVARLLLVTLLLVARAAAADVVDEVRALMARGEHAAALQHAQKHADANPRDVQARFLHGVVLMDIGRDDEALALFGTLAQLHPELPDPMNNIALLHARGGRLEQALTALQAALRNDPGHRTARANLGHVHLLLAVQAWEQVAATGPVEAALQRRLESARSLVGMPTAGAGVTAPR